MQYVASGDRLERQEYVEEQIRKKYEFLLSEQKDQVDSRTGRRTDSKTGKQPASTRAEKNTIPIGRHLRRMRMWKGLTLEQAAQGICKKNTLERMERGREESLSGFDRHFLLRSLLNRMGMFTGKFEFYYDAKERCREALRKWLVDWRKILELSEDRNELLAFSEIGNKQKTAEIPPEKQTEFLKELRLPEDASYEDALEAYEASHPVEWERVWVSWQKRIRMLSQDKSSEEISRAWEELRMQKLFYTQEEWEFLYALAAYFKRRKEYKMAGEVYRQMYQNATASGIDDERQLELLPEFCLTYGKFLWKNEETKRQKVNERESQEESEKQGEKGNYIGMEKCKENKAENILMHGIQLNLKFRRLYFLYDLMETYCAVLYSRLSDMSKENLRKKADLIDSTERKIITELLQYEPYLVALEVTQKKYGAARKRMIFMEELGWEGSTLDYTYDVSDKH